MGSELVLSLLKIVFFPFDKVDSAILMVIYAVFLFCFSFSFLRRLIHLCSGGWL